MQVMVDLETLSTESDAAIIQMGAVAFNLAGNGPREDNIFNVNVDLKSCVEKGLKIDVDTIMWWLVQNNSLRQDIALYPWPLTSVLDHFSTWYKAVEGDSIWAHKYFDLVILRNAYKACNRTPPYTYRDELDIRTIQKLADLSINHRPSTPHHALSDAIAQVYQVQDCYKKIFNIKA